MNVVAGIIIGIVADDWSVAAGYSLAWAVIHVIYGRVFGLHRNPVVESTKAGNPVVSYFIARFFTGLVTSLVFSLITLFIISVL